MPRKYNTKPPDWVVNLPPGKYDMEELVKIVNRTKATIKITLLSHGVRIKKVHSGYNNLSKNIFFWDGYQKKETT